MQWLSTLDIFFVQLILFPPFVISLGVAAAILASRIFIGPLITLIASLELNYWYFSTILPEADIPSMMIVSWAILFPLLSLYFSWMALAPCLKQHRQDFRWSK
ncbi:hypothetical protein KQ939_16820 [Planococcus sp. CP5-4]|uniref:hypothetical protein n=1 Tax=unclassified Planococcus (in: firmicutes) TaxID=2662419 RepID=UPI001C215C5B|nr:MULTISPECIES: hypothetical protein [unclassified Planococcus (in: firmicutes)]MBU9674836.1 hypothetical protein [Planococcus sp. CP5-4_YE]MBV0910531.1 hypothetical protein [Planococcus sp. CP5-4_UN]MBW6065338.1 hypothetical protein [Planococcus sp. CP5-4]